MNTQKATTNQPLQTLRDGTLKATIWRNATEKGFHYSVQLNRIYEDKEGTLQNTDRFSGSELLRIARLAQIAYDEILIHRQEDKQEEKPSAS